MKTARNLVAILFFAFVLLGATSCSNDHQGDLVDLSYKTLTVWSGGNIEVPIITKNWNIEAVVEMPFNDAVLDKDNKPMILNGYGTVEAAKGWLTITRDRNDSFHVNLKENFNKLQERIVTIWINDNGHRDYVTIVQKSGAKYKVLKTEYKEIERKVYTNNEECTNITLANHTSEAVWQPTGYIFENVVSTSHFQSDDYGAFDWAPADGVELSPPDLIIDGKSRSTDRPIYKEGITTKPYINDIENGNKILVQPYATIPLKGEVTYCKRVCNYAFTIENVATGTRFDVNGICTQVAVISTNTISYEK